MTPTHGPAAGVPEVHGAPSPRGIDAALRQIAAPPTAADWRAHIIKEIKMDYRTEAEAHARDFDAAIRAARAREAAKFRRQCHDGREGERRWIAAILVAAFLGLILAAVLA